MAFIDPSSLLSTVGTFYETQPYASAFLTCAVKGAAADLVAQQSSPPSGGDLRGGGRDGGGNSTLR